MKLRHTSLAIKLSLIVVVVLTTLVIGIIYMFNRTVNTLTTDTSTLRLAEEADLIGARFAAEQELLVSDVTFLANIPGVVQNIETNNTTSLEVVVAAASESLNLDDIDVVNREGERLLILEVEELTNASNEDVLLQAAMTRNEPVFGLVEDDEGEIAEVEGPVGENLLIAVAVPIRNAEGEVIGAIVGGRIIDEAFMNNLNSNRAKIHLAFVHYDHLVAIGFGEEANASHDHTESELATTDFDRNIFAGFQLEDAAIAQALAGEVVIIEDILENEEGTPHSLGYVPIRHNADAPVEGVVVVLVDLQEFAEFQTNTIRNTALVAMLLGVLGLGTIGGGMWYLVERPVQHLQDVSKRLTEGDYTAQVQLANRDEIGQLGEHLQELAEAIQAREEALVEMSEALEERIQERTGELEEAYEQVKEATRLKDEFLATMSHELRTPLNAIIGFLGILELDRKLDEDGTFMLERAQANSHRLLNLINDVLDISRIEAGRLQLVPVELALTDLATRLRSQIGILATEKKLELKIDIAPTAPTHIYADEDALMKILINLLGNAVKFTSEGTISLAITSHDDQIYFAVTDTGMGIPVHMHDTIFERFRQVDGTARRSYGGTGLGLAIVQELCKAMQGSVRVESTPNVGSTFTVTLPITITQTELSIS